MEKDPKKRPTAQEVRALRSVDVCAVLVQSHFGDYVSLCVPLRYRGGLACLDVMPTSISACVF